MTRRMATAAGVFVSVCGVGLAAGLLHARETRRPAPESPVRLLYLQSGRMADRVFLSFDAIASDVYWIRAIQHYGGDRKSDRTTDRFRLLQPLLDLTATLDPRFDVAYRFGAIFLSLESPNGPGRPDLAIALLERGLSSEGTRWQYAHDIGFVHYWHTGDDGRAAEWFARAAAMPGAPEWVAPLAAITRARAGDRQGARRMLSELRTSEEGYIQAAADRALAQLDALDAIDVLQSRLETFHAELGRYPADWAALVRAGMLPGIPQDPTDTPFLYDAETHTVGLSAESSLAPLPPAFRPR